MIESVDFLPCLDLSVVLLAVLITARGGSFLIEQPGGSYMEYYDKMQWLFDRLPVSWQNIYVVEPVVCDIYELDFSYDHACAPRTIFIPLPLRNSPCAITLNVSLFPPKDLRYTRYAGGWATTAMPARKGIRLFVTTSGQPSTTSER